MHSIKHIKHKLSWLVVIGFAILAPAARANLISTLTVNGCSTGCGSGPFGTVSVTQVDADTVMVLATLSPLEVFAVTGGGSPFGYNLDEAASLVAGTLTAGFATAGSNGFAGGLGTFAETIDCVGCGNGTSPPQLSGPLSFELFSASGLTSADFVANSKGFYFGADVGVENSDGTVVGTGVVGANVTNTSQVPEPRSVFLLATLLGATILSFRKRLLA